MNQPTSDSGWLKEETVNDYLEIIKSGKKPTAISLSVLDIKEPWNGYENQYVSTHWCLTHYLIDGHHKTYAAAKENTELTLLSFLAVNEGISTEENIEKLFSELE